MAYKIGPQQPAVKKRKKWARNLRKLLKKHIEKMSTFGLSTM